MRHSTRKPNRAEAWRLERLAGMRCIACVIEGCEQPHRTEIHHIVDKGYRKHSGGHSATLPICSWHHRGVSANGLTGSEMSFRYGPSLARSKRQFVEAYGTERELLERVDGILRSAA